MKKITAILAVLLALTALTACSSSSDASSSGEAESSPVSSAAEESSSVTDSAANTTTTTAPWFESVPDSDPVPEFTGEAGEYAKSFTERLSGGVYSMQLTIGAQGSQVALKAAYNGENSRITMRSAGQDIEVYRLGTELYILIPSMQAYTLEDDALMATVGLLRDYSLDPRAKLISSEEQGGIVCEIYGVPAAANTPEDYQFDERIDLKFEYRFDKATGKPREIVISSPLTGSSTARFESLVFACDEITLPDLTGWTKLTGGEKPDREQQVRMTMSLLGITEDMITNSGLSIADLAAMTDSDMKDALAKVMKENGLD